MEYVVRTWSYLHAVVALLARLGHRHDALAYHVILAQRVLVEYLDLGAVLIYYVKAESFLQPKS